MEGKALKFMPNLRQGGREVKFEVEAKREKHQHFLARVGDELSFNI